MKSCFISEKDIFPKVIQARRYGTVLFNERKFYPRVLHNYSTSLYTADGGAVIINGVRHEIKKGDLRFLRPGDTSYSEPDFECLTINFNIVEEDMFCHNRVLDSIPTYMHVPNEYFEMFKAIVKEYNQAKTCSPLVLSAKVMELICSLYNEVDGKGNMPSYLCDCIKYIKENYSSRISLEDLGSLCNYHPLHILRIFKKYLNKTPNEFITEVRIEEAKKILIGDPSVSIEEIAYRCGYNSESHFKMLFKKMTGATVGEYKRKQKFV